MPLLESIDDDRWLTDGDLFPGGEEITYTPAGESAVTINANVERKSAEAMPGAGYAQVIDVTIENHATRGRTSIRTGADKITIEPRVGETAYAFPVAEIPRHDARFWTLRLFVTG